MLCLYLDACAIIDLREKANGELGLGRAPGLLRELLGWATQGRCRVVTCELSLAECLAEPLRLATGKGEAAQEAQLRVDWYRNMIHADGVIPCVPVDRSVLDAAAQMRARHRVLKLPDAIHLASACACSSDGFVTRDSRLLGWLADAMERVDNAPQPWPATEQALEHLLETIQEP